MSSGAPHDAMARRLAEHPFFRGLSPGLLQDVAGATQDRAYRAGEFLLREGQGADTFLALEDGKVALELFATDRRITVQTLGHGEVLGWSWLTPPHRWTLDAIAVKPTHALAVDAAALRERFTQHPKDGYEFLLRLVPVLAGRLHAMQLQLFEANVL